MFLSNGTTFFAGNGKGYRYGTISRNNTLSCRRFLQSRSGTAHRRFGTESCTAQAQPLLRAQPFEALYTCAFWAPRRVNPRPLRNLRASLRTFSKVYGLIAITFKSLPTQSRHLEREPARPTLPYHQNHFHSHYVQLRHQC